MPLTKDTTRSNDNSAFLSISDCTPEMEQRAVVAVLRNCKDAEEARETLAALGLTGTAEGMLAARDERAAKRHRPSSVPA